MSPFCFFSFSQESSTSSRLFSSLIFSLFRWLHLSSKDWISSSSFILLSVIAFFSLFSLLMSSSWWRVSSFICLIWASLSDFSSWTWARRLSHSLISLPREPWLASVFFRASWSPSICSFSVFILVLRPVISFWSPDLRSSSLAILLRRSSLALVPPARETLISSTSEQSRVCFFRDSSLWLITSSRWS